MKKLFLFLAFAVGVSTTSLHAQEQQRDPAAMAQRMKERMKPQLMERTHITDAQAEQVMNLYIAQMPERRAVRELPQADRPKAISDLNQQLEKSLVGPLTIEQAGSVMNFLREREQARQQNRPAGAPAGGK